jgi:hypothetical protein
VFFVFCFYFVFLSSSCDLCTKCCLWIVHSWLSLRVSLTFLQIYLHSFIYYFHLELFIFYAKTIRWYFPYFQVKWEIGNIILRWHKARCLIQFIQNKWKILIFNIAIVCKI